MLGQRTPSAASSVDSRMFVYEVAGLSQDEAIARQRPPIRSSQNQTFQVPFHRMNEEMRRITLLGGEIVKISPLNANPATSQAASSTEESSAESAEASAE
ncbi:MAG: phycobilisome linker polypeptide [Phormidesmis sp.]